MNPPAPSEGKSKNKGQYGDSGCSRMTTRERGMTTRMGLARMTTRMGLRQNDGAGRIRFGLWNAQRPQAIRGEEARRDSRPRHAGDGMCSGRRSRRRRCCNYLCCLQLQSRRDTSARRSGSRPGCRYGSARWSGLFTGYSPQVCALSCALVHAMPLVGTKLYWSLASSG